ncbi:hypothetical protein MO973_19535 [Paenibacillus sp. TRM 82003]|nr:hypothetical protein [Paenibacillus sp. TRM 82003]
MAGRFAEITKTNKEAKKRKTDPSQNADALRQEQRRMVEEEPQRAPALSVPEGKVETQPASQGRFASISNSGAQDGALTSWFKRTFNVPEPDPDRVGGTRQLFGTNPVTSAVDRFGQAGTRLIGAPVTLPEATTGNKFADTAVDVAGSVAGVFVNPLGPTSSVAGQSSIVGQAYNNPLTQRLATQAAGRFASPKASRVASEAVREGIAGAVEGGAQAAIRGESLGNIAAQTAMGGGIGGTLGGAAPVAGDYLQKLIGAFRPQRAVESAQGPILALPEPQMRGNPNRAQTPDVITASGKVEPIGLPEPNIAPPTTARVTRQANPAREKLEAFALAMQGAQLPPGREREVFLEAWGKFAGPNDPDLETMIDMAYSSRPNRLSPDLAQRARETQRMREVAGVGMPVRSMSERYQGGVQGAAAMPETVVGRRGTNPSLREAAQRLRPQETPVQTVRPSGVDQPIVGMRREPTPQPQPLREASQKLTDDGVPELAKPVAKVEEVAAAAKQDWFTKLFGTQGVGIIPGFRRQGRNTLTTEGQIVDSPIKNTVQGVVENTKAVARSTYQHFVDMNDPLKAISKEVYDASMDANRANQLANVIISDKFVTPEGQVVGEGLQNIIRKVGRGNYNAFGDYLVARHARTRMARGEAVYDKKLEMTPEKLQERIGILERRYPEFAAIAKEWDGYYRNMRSVYGVDGDLISKDLAAYLEKENPNYASMRRQFTNLEKIKGLNNFAQRGTFSGQKAPMQEVSPVGSTRKIVDPVRTAVEQTGAWVNAVMRNRVMKEIVTKISADPDSMKGIAEIVQPPKGSPNLKEILDAEGEEGYIEMLQKEFNDLFKRGPVDKDNIVRAMVKGEPVYVKVHDVEAVKALLGMGAEQANVALAIMQAFSNTIKQGATGALAPLFAVKGASMDVAQALIQSENPLAHSGYLIGSVFSAIGEQLKIPGLRKWAQDYYRAGGGYSAALRGERGLQRNVGRMRLDPLLSPRTLAKGVGRTIAAPYKASIAVADIAENMNRIAAYNYKMRKLGGQPTPENVREAMNYAREITTNYSRRGRQSQMLEALIPYNNAAVQGMYRFAKAWKKNPVKTSAMVGMTVLAPKAYEYIRFHEDEDYQQLPARERYRNLILSKNPDGTFNKMPIAPEYNALGALMVDTLRAYRDGDPEAFKGVSDALANSFTPPMVTGALQGLTQGGGVEQSGWGMVNSTSVGPILGALGNMTFYGGPVESMKVQDRSPGMRYDERTSGPAKWLGEQLNLSPMKIDYILRAYGGDPARLLLPLTSQIGAGRTKETLLKNFIVDPTFTNNITNDFYQGKDLISQAYRDHQEVEKPLPKWFSEDLRKLVTSTAKGSVSKRASELYEEKRQVQLDKSLTQEQKAQKLRDIQAQINGIFIDVNAKMREAGVPILNR